jgi:hypothetical protein
MCPDLPCTFSGSDLDDPCTDDRCCAARSPSVLTLLGGLLGCVLFFGLSYAAYRKCCSAERWSRRSLKATKADAKPLLASSPQGGVVASDQKESKETGGHSTAFGASSDMQCKASLPECFSQSSNPVNAESVALHRLNSLLEHCFSPQATAESFGLTSHALGYITHAQIQKQTVRALVTQQLLRCK